MSYFNYNGKLCREGLPVIGPDNRGLRYGDGLFETMKMIQGKLVFGDEHFARLWNGLKLLQFELPRHFTPEMLHQQILSLAEKNGHTNSARIRLQIIRGDGGLYDAKNHIPGYIIQTWLLPEEQGEWNSNGLVIGTYDTVKKSCDVTSNFKHNNFLPYVLAALEAKSRKWDDAVLLNNYSRICDTTIANIFMVKDQVISTPPLTEGCVAGIIRKAIIKGLPEKSWQIVEQELTLDQLFTADELFLTNSLYNIRWVQRLGKASYRNEVTKKIFIAFKPLFDGDV